MSNRILERWMRGNLDPRGGGVSVEWTFRLIASNGDRSLYSSRLLATNSHEKDQSCIGIGMAAKAILTVRYSSVFHC